MAQSTTVLWRFQFSTTQALAIEVGNYTMRFYKNGAIINVGVTTVPYVLDTIYPAEDVDGLYFKQINDVVYICHPNHPPHKLTRYADDSWTLQVIDFTYPPFLDQNFEEDVIVTPSGTDGTITLTSTISGIPFGIFNEDMVDGFFRIGHQVPADDVELALTANGSSDSLEIVGDYEINTHGNWGGKLKLESSTNGGSTWMVEKIFESVWTASPAAGSKNFEIAEKTTTRTLYRLTMTDYVGSLSGAKATLSTIQGLVWGYVEITGYTNTSQVTASVIDSIALSEGTYWWAHGAWNRYCGYPRTVCLHELRILYGGTNLQPSTFWGSASDDFDNFDKGTNADGDSYAYQIAGTELNEINWMVSHTSLIVGTSGAIYRVKGDNTGKNITPTQVDIQMQEEVGVEKISPVVVEGAILFVARKGRKLMELMYSYEQERFSAKDITIKSEHLFSSGIRTIEYQFDPIPTVWAVLKNGNLAGLAYNRDEEVLGWSIHNTDGLFESCAAIYGSTDANDELWVIVDREIQYSRVKMVERFYPEIWSTIQDAFFVDSGITYSGTATGTVTGLDHLNDKVVDALADGVVYQGLTVTDGSITLPGSATATKIHVGLPYTSELKPFRLDTDQSIGPSLGRIKRIGGLHARVQDSSSFKYEFNNVDVEHNLGTGLYSGDVKLDYFAGSDYDPSVTIKQDKPLPLSIQALLISYDVTGSI